jgi:hypothetical protein
MHIETTMLVVTLLGVLFLGGFVGFLLALAIDFSSTLNLKVVSALIGAALGGAPILFMRGLGFEKWMYPIGLVIGFLWIRVIRSVTLTRGGTHRRKKLMAWVDTMAILLVTLIVIICAAFFSAPQ